MFLPLKFMRVHGESMRPTLNPGELIAVAAHAYDRRQPRRGEVVAARPAACGGRLMVKRLGGVPQDEVMVEGRCWQLQEEQFFLLGDRSDESTDSRTFGPVTRQELIGPVACCVWPWRRLTAARAEENGNGQSAQVS